MDITRRGFLKISGAVTGYLLASPLFDPVKVPEALADVGPKTGVETTSICYGCACGCGVIVTASGGKVVNVEGDPTHPVNEGALCSKCHSMYQTVNQLVDETDLINHYWEGKKFGKQTTFPLPQPYWPAGKRAARVLWRKAYGTEWKVVTWTWALQRMAQLIYNWREATLELTDGPVTVNRTQAIAALGGAAHDNQECYLMRKLYTGLGLVYVEHQARI